jgi:hypothetical protein
MSFCWVVEEVSPDATCGFTALGAMASAALGTRHEAVHLLSGPVVACLGRMGSIYVDILPLCWLDGVQ